MGIYHSIACLFKSECCNAASIPGNTTRMKEEFEMHVFGQHIATDLVLNAIAAHWNSNHAKKPLTMSFHGYTGSGKNFIAQIIAESLYVKGMKSKYVTLFSRIDFPEKSNISTYKKNLYDYVKSKVSECGRHLFIFDEVEHMHPGILDGIKTVLDYYDNVENVDYRQAIFIFLSNTGSLSISNHFLELWRAGVHRSSIKLVNFEMLIAQGAFNTHGGLFRSDTIKNNLIDHYVPFLPMEREHVEKCVRSEFGIRDVVATDGDIEEVMAFIEWAPPPENKFAKTGCKRISQKVATMAFKRRHAHEQIEHREL